MEDKIVIIGAGPAGLMAAQKLAENGLNVHVFEQNKTAGRKFLVAGNGGFNLTYQEHIDSFITKYDSPLIGNIVKQFDNKQVINWLSQIGITTYVGSSGKIFPTKNYKPIQVLNAWLDYLKKLNVNIHYEHEFIDFDEQSVTLKHNDKVIKIKYFKLILAMGGGSWKKTGSNAKWISILQGKKIEIKSLESANSGYNTDPKYHHLQGQYIKNIKVSFDNIEKIGEIVFTKYGIEGSPIYYMNRFTRGKKFPLIIDIDLKPNLTTSEIHNHLKQGIQIGKILKYHLNFSKTTINLLKTLEKNDYINPEVLSKTIKQFPVEIWSYRPMDEVISTSGGISLSSLTEKLELKNYAHIFCAGEMIDWEAPTGGYLLQACFSTGDYVAKEITKQIYK